MLNGTASIVQRFIGQSYLPIYDDQEGEEDPGDQSRSISKQAFHVSARIRPFGVVNMVELSTLPEKTMAKNILFHRYKFKSEGTPYKSNLSKSRG